MIELKLYPENNPKLGRLASINESKGVPNSALPKELQHGLGVIWTLLTGTEFDLEANTLYVACKEGSYNRTYVPKLYRTPQNELVLRWGKTDIPLLLQKGGIVPAYTGFSLPDGYMLEIGFATTKARYEELSIEITLVSPEYPKGLLCYFPVSNYKDAPLKNEKEFKTALKTGNNEDIIKSLLETKEFTEYAPRETLDKLTKGVQYLVVEINSYVLQKRAGKAHTLTVVTKPEGYKQGDALDLSDAKRYFANQQIDLIMQSDPAPVIDVDNPAELQLVKLEKKKTGEGFKPVVFFQPTKWAETPTDSGDYLRLDWF